MSHLAARVDEAGHAMDPGDTTPLSSEDGHRHIPENTPPPRQHRLDGMEMLLITRRPRWCMHAQLVRHRHSLQRHTGQEKLQGEVCVGDQGLPGRSRIQPALEEPAHFVAPDEGLTVVEAAGEVVRLEVTGAAEVPRRRKTRCNKKISHIDTALCTSMSTSAWQLWASRTTN